MVTVAEDFPESSDSPTESEPDVNLAEDRVLQLIQVMALSIHMNIASFLGFIGSDWSC